MFLELSEVFVCPACRPAQGLVVLVDDIEERRVRRGHLGCPECEARVPIRDGVLRFDLARGAAGSTEDARPADAGPTPEGEAALLAGVPPEEAATRIAALLGADGTDGCLLLGPGLAGLAAPVARLAGEAEVLALEAAPQAAGAGTGGAEEGPGPGTGGGPGRPAGEAVSRAAGIRPARLPVMTGRLAGVALLRPGPQEVREAVRVLEEGGRAVLLEPTREGREALEASPVRIAAAAEDAVVAVREPGAGPARG